MSSKSSGHCLSPSKYVSAHAFSHVRELRCNYLNQIFVLGPVIFQQLKTT